MGVLNVSAESLDLPDWMLVHPELEPQIKDIRSPFFVIYYTYSAHGKTCQCDRLFSIPKITNTNSFDLKELRRIVQKNSVIIGNHIVRVIRDKYPKNVKIEFKHRLWEC